MKQKYFYNTIDQEFFLGDDYNASHIIKTIILNKYNCKHVGFHHSAFFHPHISTLLTYTCFNIYYTPEKYLNELYRDYWFSDSHEIVGQPYLDYIISAKNNSKIQDKLAAFLKNEINILFGIPTIEEVVYLMIFQILNEIF